MQKLAIRFLMKSNQKIICFPVVERTTYLLHLIYTKEQSKKVST